MAWKLKRTKSGEDEPTTKGLKPHSETDTAVDFQHKPGAFEPVANEYDTDTANQDRTVMLINDEDFLPDLIPSMGSDAEADSADTEAGAAAETPHAESDDFLASALIGEDDGASLLASVREESDSSAYAAPGGSSEEWDLDAFAPYQPATSLPDADDLGVVTGPSSLDIEPSTSFGGNIDQAPIEPSVEPIFALPSATGRLVVRLGQFSASYEVSKAEVTIGRPDPRMDVFPDVAIEWDDAVSRNHARVLHRTDGDYIEDTGSTNGTKLNNKPLGPNKPMLLQNGDRIQLGEKTEITYTV